MRPKGKLLTLIVLFAAVGVITATGAFTTVEAERTATVDVAGDSSALLQLQAANDDAEDYVTTNDNGAIEINLDGSDASGLNPNARTVLTPLVNITNQGTDEVTVNITVDGDQVDNTDIDEIVTVVKSDGESYSENNAPAGESAEEFGLEIDLRGVDVGEDEDFDIEITIEANANGN